MAHKGRKRSPWALVGSRLVLIWLPPHQRRALRPLYRDDVPLLPRSAVLAPVILAVAALGGCSAAQDAVTSATDDAKQQAVSKAQEIAVQALTAQACTLTKDGALSAADAKQLGGALDTARAAGVPAQLLDAVQPLVETGAGASRDQVRQVHAQLCGS